MNRVCQGTKKNRQSLCQPEVPFKLFFSSQIRIFVERCQGNCDNKLISSETESYLVVKFMGPQRSRWIEKKEKRQALNISILIKFAWGSMPRRNTIYIMVTSP